MFCLSKTTFLSFSFKLFLPSFFVSFFSFSFSFFLNLFENNDDRNDLFGEFGVFFMKFYFDKEKKKFYNGEKIFFFQFFFIYLQGKKKTNNFFFFPTEGRTIIFQKTKICEHQHQKIFHDLSNFSSKKKMFCIFLFYVIFLKFILIFILI